MSIYQYEVFKMVADCESLSEAGKRLHLSQPGVSNQINTLEKALGVKLFDRHPHGVHMTEAGKVVYEFAERITQSYRELEMNLEKTAQQADLEVRVAANKMLSIYFLKGILMNFQEKYPHAEIISSTYQNKSVINKLFTKKIEIGFVDGPLEQNVLQGCLVAIDQLVAVESQYTSRKPMDSLDACDLIKTPLLLLDSTTGVRKQLDMIFSKQGIVLKSLTIKRQYSDINELIHAVIADQGVSILPRIAVEASLQAGLMREIKLPDWDFYVPYWILIHPDTKVSLVSARIQKYFLNLRGELYAGSWDNKSPCWEIVDCKKHCDDTCVVFAKKISPCWTVQGTPCKGESGLSTEICQECTVYKKYGKRQPILITNN